ncbi:MAG: LysM peptidoglycan-binding domain-containing protein [Oscillospiraceae bacterium]|nr:LysM peptidoglycan-binding domain-containing protein [Oscillospiraceae bacterium]
MQKLFFSERQSRENDTLPNCHIRENCTLHLKDIAAARPMLRWGDVGTYVIKLQTLLTNLDFSPGSIDGIFGDLTGNAVRAFQRANGLASDGVVGPMTWEALLNSNPSSFFEYTVQSGDSLWLLARKFGTSVDVIKDFNGLTGDLIFIGQILKIPKSEKV